MTRHITCRFLFVPAAALLMLAAAGSLLAAERAGGMRQQPLDPGAGRISPGAPVKPPPPQQTGIAGGPGWGASRVPVEERQKVDSASITYRGTHYLVTEGRWYERRGNDLVPVTAPAGVMVPDLPEGYSMRWVGGVPYFYADGLYYVWRERKRRYEILRTPPDVETLPAAGETRPEPGRDTAATP